MNAGRPHCFVVTVYAKRTDPEASKVLDLDKTFRSVVVEGVRATGFEPIRSDQIVEPGMISRQMYRLLMDAELVVGDLTTLNPNALFELGVRMGLRRNATVVIAAEGTKVPFNPNQERFFFYRHGGEVIDYEDAQSAQVRLAEVCRPAVSGTEPDRLIYSIFHTELDPPKWKNVTFSDREGPPPEGMIKTPDSFAAQRAFVDRAKGAKQWAEAIARLRELHDQADREQKPVERWFTQQWALAAYKQREMEDSVDLNDLRAACEIMRRLMLESSTDAETLGLWAPIHKRLSELPDRQALSRKQELALAIASYRKGYVLRIDHYNGINYAFLLVRRAVDLADPDELRDLRDIVEARDTWAHLGLLCQEMLGALLPDVDAASGQAPQQREQVAEQFWRTASLAQALLGLGDARHATARERHVALQTLLRARWMMEISDKRERALKGLMQKQRFARLSSYAPLVASGDPGAQ